MCRDRMWPSLVGRLRRKVPRGGFLAGVAALATGTAVAQAVPVFVAPVLTRIYSPKDFGLLLLFTSLVAVGSVIACARYELAIVLPDDEDDAAALFALSVAIAGVVSSILLICFAISPRRLAVFLGNPAIEYWLFLVPVVIFLSASFGALTYVTTRDQAFGLLARAKVLQAVAGNGSQLGLGQILPGPSGLLVGNAISSSAAIRSLVRNGRARGSLRMTSAARIRRVAVRYADFPKYSLASGLAQSLSLLIISILVARYYSADALGQYSLALRVFAIPTTLVAGSVGHVFFQRASQEFQKSATIAPVFRKTFRVLAIISAVSSGLLFLILPSLFDFAFGSAWREAGELARSLLPGFALQFIVAPLTFSMIVLGRVRLGLLVDLGLLIGMSTTLFLAAALGAKASDALLFMSWAQATLYVGYLLLIWRLVRRNPAR